MIAESRALFHKGLRLIVRWISIVAQWQIVYNLRLIATFLKRGPGCHLLSSHFRYAGNSVNFRPAEVASRDTVHNVLLEPTGC